MDEYPALYKAANELSRRSQNLYLNLLRAEYALLLSAAILSIDLSKSRIYYSAYALIFVLALGTLLFRSHKKPEQDWYKGRALAESIKTSTWRYCMKSAPFSDSEDIRISRTEFAKYLKGVLEANRGISERFSSDFAAGDQITSEMERARSLELADRKQFYLDGRIRNQRDWYRKKAAYNKKRARQWVIASSLVYAAAISVILYRIAEPNWTIWPIEPLIVVASSIVGWIQIKKFNELASSYTLTAHEIGIAQAGLSEVKTEQEFSDFVNETELAFSREHTQWVARQQH
ncbi:DUF4231 domain-containing protein [Kaistia sp. UC242_56]|uniref:DUF4231 domain-containing protein n=1 Tax=Kaistia sp. UC242_56 TaxID=3374625 RepID=UPI0037A4CDBC